MTSTTAYVGLVCYVVFFILMLVRNYNAVAQGQHRREKVQQFIVDCLYDKHNPAYFSAVLICIVTIVTFLLFIGFGKGLIFNIFQQGFFASWLISLFRHFLSILDPFQRVTDNELNASLSFWLHVSLALTCLAMSMLLWAGIEPTVYHGATTVNIFFMGIAVFIMCITFRAARILMQFYMCCRRGLQAKLKDVQTADDKTPTTWLAQLKIMICGSDIETAQLIPSADAGCMRSLVLQKLMLERLLGLCILTFVFNFYKLTWSASLTGCFFRRNCTPEVAITSAETIIHNISYWLPDFVGFLYWFVFLLNPLSVQLKSSVRKSHGMLVANMLSNDVIHNSGSFALGPPIPDRPSEAVSSVEMSTNPLFPELRTRSLSSEGTPMGRPDVTDLQRLSRKSKQRSVRNLFMSASSGGDAHSSVSGGKAVVSSLLKNLTSQSDCREIHLSLNEMVLVDKRIGLPVPSLFAGRDTFVVMSVMGLDGCEGGKKKRTSGVMERIGDKFRSVSRSSRGILRGAVSDEQHADSPDLAWKEVARSDCRVNEANPEFIVSFIIPVIDDDGEGHDTTPVRWRFDIYNECTVDPSFRSELAGLDEQKLIGVIHVANCEFNPRRNCGHSRSSHMSWQQTSSNSDDEDDEVHPLPAVSDAGDGAVIVQKDILVRPYGDNYVRLGGVGFLQARLVSPFSQLITELGSVNSMKHPNALRASLNATGQSDRKSEIQADDVTTSITHTPQRNSGRTPHTSDNDTALARTSTDAEAVSRGNESVPVPPQAFSTTPSEREPESSHEVLMRAFSFLAMISNATSVRRNIRVVEEMVESPYSFQVPLAYMKCLLVERYMEMDVLMNRFNVHDAPLDYDGDNWHMGIIASMQRNLMGLKESMREYDSTTATFKPSAKKSDFGLRYIPINLHIQIMTMSGMQKSTDRDTGAVRLADFESSFTCDFVTVGAFAAHPMKFKSGGLWHMMRAFDSRLEKMTRGEVPAPSSGFRSPDEVWNTESLKDFPAEKKLFNLALAARERLDICLAQCLGAVATGFVSRLQLMSPAALERIATVGLLFQFESLLSTQGSELGMLSDMYCTIRCLNRVHLKIHEDREPNQSGRESRRVSINGPEASVSVYWGNADGFDDQVLIIDMGFIPQWFARLPQIIKDGKTIPVVPVLFSVGINELQSYAETMNGKKASALQDVINMENLQRVENYCNLVIRLEKGEFDNVASASTSDGISPRSRGSSAAADMMSLSSTRSHYPSLLSESTQTTMDSVIMRHETSVSADSTLVFATAPHTGTGLDTPVTISGASGNGRPSTTLHDTIHSHAELDEVNDHVHSSCVVTGNLHSAPAPTRIAAGSEDAGSTPSDTVGDRDLQHRRSSCNDTDTTMELRDTSLDRAHQPDRGIISRRRQAVNRTSTAAALKGGASRRRLSSIMTPVMVAGYSTAISGSPESESSIITPSVTTQRNSSLTTAAATTSTTGGPLHTDTDPDSRGEMTSGSVMSSPLSTEDAAVSSGAARNVSSVKIWDMVEDDSDDDEDSVEERCTDAVEVVRNQLLHVKPRESINGSGGNSHGVRDQIQVLRGISPVGGGAPTRGGSVGATSSNQWDDNDDDQDGVIARDIEKAINDHQHQHRDTDMSLFDGPLSLSHFVSSVTSALPSSRTDKTSKGNEQTQQRASSPTAAVSSAAGAKGTFPRPSSSPSSPRRRGTGIAHRLMQYVSNPMPSSIYSRRSNSDRDGSKSIDDPTCVFGEEEEGEDGIDVELGLEGLRRSMHNDESAGEQTVVPPAADGRRCSGTSLPAPLAKTSSSYLRDCLEVRDSSILSSEISTSGATQSSGAVVSDFENRITHLLSLLSNTVRKSEGAGGKPYQILTIAAKLTRALDGVRYTSCKSAKDRTGMSVTLEEASLVKDVYNITAVETKALLDALRVYGLRLENAKKNVGKATFAFNSIQRRFLPRAYAPPVSVVGNVSS